MQAVSFSFHCTCIWFNSNPNVNRYAYTKLIKNISYANDLDYKHLSISWNPNGILALSFSKFVSLPNLPTYYRKKYTGCSVKNAIPISENRVTEKLIFVNISLRGAVSQVHVKPHCSRFPWELCFVSRFYKCSIACRECVESRVDVLFKKRKQNHKSLYTAHIFFSIILYWEHITSI